MKDISEWQVPKWPFLAGNLILILGAVYFFGKDAHPNFPGDAFLPSLLVALGAVLGCLPYILEYRATQKLVELNALSTVAEQLADLKKYSELIAAATGQWAQVQETTKGNTDKTVAAAREISERMAGEIREFNEFQVKLNDTEKGALRLEVEKLRRTETEWLQVVARILDHIFALHNAAVRSGNTDLAEQIVLFQNACREATRRVGLVSFGATPAEPFDPQKHRAHGVENPPAGSLIEETLALGMTFQGRQIRHALVRLRPAPAPTVKTSPETAGEKPAFARPIPGKAAKPLKPAELGKPAEPVKSAELIIPAEPAKAAEIIKPAESVKPAPPTEAAKPAKPAEPSRPAREGD
jgi:molecular chaperone GrpE (heat shock protein)